MQDAHVNVHTMGKLTDMVLLVSSLACLVIWIWKQNHPVTIVTVTNQLNYAHSGELNSNKVNTLNKFAKATKMHWVQKTAVRHYLYDKQSHNGSLPITAMNKEEGLRALNNI